MSIFLYTRPLCGSLKTKKAAVFLELNGLHGQFALFYASFRNFPGAICDHSLSEVPAVTPFRFSPNIIMRWICAINMPQPLQKNIPVTVVVQPQVRSQAYRLQIELSRPQSCLCIKCPVTSFAIASLQAYKKSQYRLHFYRAIQLSAAFATRLSVRLSVTLSHEKSGLHALSSLNLDQTDTAQLSLR